MKVRGYIVEMEDIPDLWVGTLRVRGIGFTWYQKTGVIIDVWHKRISIRR